MTRRPLRTLATSGPRHGISPPLLSTPLAPQKPARNCDGSGVHHIAVGPVDPFGEPDDIVEVECRGCPACRQVIELVPRKVRDRYRDEAA